MFDSESESGLQKQESLHYFSSTPTQRGHTTCALGHIIDYTKPDITILCDICKCFINVSELKMHTIYHNALKLFKFKDVPNKIDIILKRRDLLIQRMQRLKISEQSYLKYVKTINDAFQIIKRTIEPYYYGDNSCIYDNREASNVQGISFTPRNRLFLSIGVCTSQNKQYKTDMEDTMRFIDCFGGKEKFACIGLFDGYNGKAASTLCREHLHDAILMEMSKLINDMNSSEAEQALINRLYTSMIDPSSDHCNIKTINDVYRLAYLKMDHLLSRGIHETSSVRWSGASAFTAVVVANDNIEELLINLEDDNDEKQGHPVLGHIHVANCGNVEALGIRAGEVFLMSQKHTLSNKRERERILETGIKISDNDLIAGIHETTRGLGNHGDKDVKKCVINSPYFWTYEIDPSLECIILATEGLWQVLQYDVVADIVTQCLPAHHMPAPSRMDAALRSVLERYGNSTHTPYLTHDDDIIINCMDEMLYLIEEENDNDKSNLLSTCNRAVQCSEDEIHQEIWNSLSAQYRLRLELAQTIAERLVSAALLAQSKANISVVCLLLPGAAV
ncbi:unnamed protein product [Rotaria sp. Silwood2]|nr:unnamed protein product [Rotaria sp. Silwood2]CAF3269645.1 unnamed protein product [Rotaria sp. Silwood2]CAF3899493.1 unnamed protein product [Rotaria sp. Silwood2]CAF4052065.1 unnamed protein product [Rotaria sp. Silwood2]CAF4114321.1 unnamed protein product [Rotaria sp. Silwood2]